MANVKTNIQHFNKFFHLLSIEMLTLFANVQNTFPNQMYSKSIGLHRSIFIGAGQPTGGLKLHSLQKTQQPAN